MKGKTIDVFKNETDDTYSSENTFPIIFKNNVRQPSHISEHVLPSLKRQLYQNHTLEAKQSEESRDLAQNYNDRNLKSFFRQPVNPKYQMESIWKPKKDWVRYQHVKPRIDSNISSRYRSGTFTNNNTSLNVSRKHLDQIRKGNSKTRTPTMSLYLEAFNNKHDSNKIMDNQETDYYKKVGTEGSTQILPLLQTEKDQRKIEVINQPLINPKQQPVDQGIVPTTPKQVRSLKQALVIQEEVRLNTGISQQENEERGPRQRKNSLDSQVFSVMTKPNFDLDRFAQKLNSNAESKTYRTSSNHSGLLFPKNITPNTTQQVLNQHVKTFKPRSDIFKDADFSTFRIKKYKNGVFFGQLSVQDQQGIQIKQGLGCVFYYTGKLYEGEFDKDLKCGKGFELYPDSSYYEGEFAGGQKAGCGRFVWSNGQIYDGQWKQGKKHGSGMWKGEQKSKQSYIGQWFSGKAHGFGVLTNAVGDRYQGQFKVSVKDGQGTQRFVNGDVYVGTYQKGRRNGPGEMFYSNGDSYKGDFCNNLRHGQGILSSMGNTIVYEGEYRNDKKCGYGTFFFQNASMYTGNFQNDLMHGSGMLTNNLEVIEGLWVNGVCEQHSSSCKCGNGHISRHQEPQTVVKSSRRNIKIRQNLVAKNKPVYNMQTTNVTPQRPNIKKEHPTHHHSKSPPASISKGKTRLAKSQSKLNDLRGIYAGKRNHNTSLQLPKSGRRACGCAKHSKNI